MRNPDDLITAGPDQRLAQQVFQQRPGKKEEGGPPGLMNRNPNLGMGPPNVKGQGPQMPKKPMGPRPGPPVKGGQPMAKQMKGRPDPRARGGDRQKEGQGPRPPRMVDMDVVDNYAGGLKLPPNARKQQQQEVSPEPEQLEAVRQNQLLEQKKGVGAARHYIIDPMTGFAIDRRALRKNAADAKALAIAKALPAEDRAVFLWKQGVINKEDIPEESAKDQLELANTKIKMMASIISLENAVRDRNDYISPRDKEIMQSIRGMISKGNYEGALMLSEQMEKPLDFDVKKLIESDQKYLLNQAKKDNFTDTFFDGFGVKYQSFRDDHKSFMMEASKMLKPDPLNPEAFKLRLKEYGVPSYQDVIKMSDVNAGHKGKPWNDWKKNFAETTPYGETALRQLPSKGATESDYLNFLKEVYVMHNMYKLHGPRTTDMYGAHQQWLDSKKAKVLNNAIDPKVKATNTGQGSGQPADLNQVGGETVQNPVQQPSQLQTLVEKPIDGPTTEGGGNNVPKPNPNPVLKEPPPQSQKGQQKVMKVSGGATSILSQVKQAGYPANASLTQFINDLNKATGKNYTAKSLPAQMPVFWSRKDDKKTSKYDDYGYTDLASEMGNTMKQEIVDPVVDTAKEIYTEGPVRAGLMNLGTLSQLPLFPDSGDRAIEHGEKGSGQNPNPSIMDLIFGNKKK